MLTTSSLVPVQNSDAGEKNYQGLTLKQSVTLLDSLRSCWREDVLVLSCSDRFLRLSLQLLSRSVKSGMLGIFVVFWVLTEQKPTSLWAYRYSSWLSSGLTARKNHNTSTGPGCEWAVSAVIDDFILVCIVPSPYFCVKPLCINLTCILYAQ